MYTQVGIGEEQVAQGRGGRGRGREGEGREERGRRGRGREGREGGGMERGGREREGEGRVGGQREASHTQGIDRWGGEESVGEIGCGLRNRNKRIPGRRGLYIIQTHTKVQGGASLPDQIREKKQYQV